MTEAADIAALAERVRSLIRSDPFEGATALVLFANAHAITSRLKHRALIAKFTQHDTTNAAEQTRLTQEMLDLVELVEQDHAQHARAPAVRAREQFLQTLRQQYLERAAQARPVFVGSKLGKRYVGAGFHLRGVDLTLRPGEITAVVGQNAHGKTTLLRIVAGELRADQGTLAFPSISGDDAALDWIRIKSQVAYLPQELPGWRGALDDNLHYAAALHGLHGQDNEREVAFYVERLGLRAHLNRRWSELSSGYKLRFALAQVLLGRPQLLVLDEPLANLDVMAQSRFLQDIMDLARARRYPLAVLLSSQHLPELEAVSSTAIFLREGEVVFNGPVQAIGEGRTHNVYELGTSTEAGVLEQVLATHQLGNLSHNGVSYVIKAERSVDVRQLLDGLLRSGVEIYYLRDISRSMKRLFE